MNSSACARNGVQDGKQCPATGRKKLPPLSYAIMDRRLMSSPLPASAIPCPP